MDDRDLIALLRTAEEADQLGGPGASRWPAAIVPARSGPGAKVWAAGFAAAAVLVLAGAVWWMGRNAPDRLGPIATIKDPTRVPTEAALDSPNPGDAVANAVGSVDPNEPHGAMLVAMFKDGAGSCRCVVQRDVTPNGISGDGLVCQDELLTLALQDACAAGADRVVILGLSGPRSSLPSTEAEAEELAVCLDPDLAAGFERACLPGGVEVLSATWTLGAIVR